MNTKREEAESNEDKAKQAQKQESAKSGGTPAQPVNREAFTADNPDSGTPSINEPPGSDVIPPETKAAVEQANRDLEKQAQDAAKATANQQDDDDEDKKGKKR